MTRRFIFKPRMDPILVASLWVGIPAAVLSLVGVATETRLLTFGGVLIAGLSAWFVLFSTIEASRPRRHRLEILEDQTVVYRRLFPLGFRGPARHLAPGDIQALYIDTITGPLFERVPRVHVALVCELRSLPDSHQPGGKRTLTLDVADRGDHRLRGADLPLAASGQRLADALGLSLQFKSTLGPLAPEVVRKRGRSSRRPPMSAERARKITMLTLVLATLVIAGFVLLMFAADGAFIERPPSIRRIHELSTELERFAGLKLNDSLLTAIITLILVFGLATFFCLTSFPYSRAKRAAGLGRIAKHALLPVISALALSIICATYVDAHPRASVVSQRQEAAQIADHVRQELEQMLVGAGIPGGANVVLHNTFTPNAQGVIKRSESGGRHSRANGQNVGLTWGWRTTLDEIANERNKGDSETWQLLRWVQALTFDLRPRITVDGMPAVGVLNQSGELTLIWITPDENGG